MKIDGKKTYFVSLIWGLAVAAQTAGFIDPHQLEIIQSVLVPLGLATLRHGIKKNEE